MTKSSDGVGKKIVEALKKQAEPDITNDSGMTESGFEDFEDIQDDSFENNIDNVFADSENNFESTQTLNQNSFNLENYDEPKSIYQQPVTQGFPAQDVEIKADNVKILNNLINQLPAGISKQTGAQIIKQTMEAMGISMKTVLEEAQQIQEKISMSSNDCLNAIQEYKKQIHQMEKQVQQYHKEYNSLNELISLFVQTGI